VRIKLDFVIHWLWAIAFAILTLSGLAMVGAKYGWILNWDIASADYIHRVAAMFFMILLTISIGQEAVKAVKNDKNKLTWGIIGPKGYGLFNFITSVIFTITGVIIWVGHEYNMASVAFSLYIHEKLTYLVIIGVIWHIYVKAYALIWPEKKKLVNNNE